jgi:cytochrome P450
LAHDPRKYDQPEIFNPERYFDGKGNLTEDDEIYAFGFGRRICVGRHMASATVWLSIAAVLSTFNVQKKKDSSGKEIPLNGEYTDGLVSHPLPYECSVTPRSDGTARLVMEAVGKKV